ncbi:MAG TPA: DUF3379 family protein, partial [Steroidobacteraceae bacterium]|nr:DUF3379 family protein [Steroidobacteraceae bacterium]
MNCTHARLLIGAEPHGTDPELTAHLASCAACATFREEMRALEARIGRALERPPGLAAARRAQRRAPWQEWALAASVLLAVILGAGVWLLRPSDTLARDLVAHVQHEPDSWFA